MAVAGVTAAANTIATHRRRTFMCRGSTPLMDTGTVMAMAMVVDGAALAGITTGIILVGITAEDITAGTTEKPPRWVYTFAELADFRRF